MSARTRGSRSKSKNSNDDNGRSQTLTTDVEVSKESTTPEDTMEVETVSVSKTVATRASSRRSQRTQNSITQADTTNSPSNNTHDDQPANRDEENQREAKEGKKDEAAAVENKDDDFMRSEHFPKICSRVGVKYQAAIPPFEPPVTAASTTELTDSSPSLSACIWSLNNSFLLSSDEEKDKSEKSNGGMATVQDEARRTTPVGAEGGQILERYLAQAKLIMSKFYQSQLNGRMQRNSHLLSPLQQRNGVSSEGECEQEDREQQQQQQHQQKQPPRDSDSDYDGNIHSDRDDEDDRSSSDTDEDYDCERETSSSRAQHQQRHKTTFHLPVEKKGRGRPRSRPVKPSNRQHMTAISPRKSKGMKVNPDDPVIDGSFFMITSCLEDFLLELLLKR